MYSAVLLLAITTAPEPAACCWGCGWGWGWNYYVPTWTFAPAYYYYPAFYPAYYYQPTFWPGVTPVVAVTAKAKEKQPALDGIETASRARDRDEGRTRSATVIVTLPARARLTVDGQPLNDSSPRRLFNTPLLKPGARYSYLMTAEIERDGQSEQRTRKVVVQAGRQTLVNFDFDAVASDR